MKRWDCNTCTSVEVPKIDEFIKEIVSVYKKYDMSISHEDSHGALEIAEYDEENVRWLEDAHIEKGLFV